MSRQPILLALAFLLLVAFIPAGFGQDTALVLLRPSGTDKGACTTGVEPALVTIRDFKINGKTDIRLAGESVSPSPALAITRARFGQMRKMRLKDSGEIEFREGLMYVSTGGASKTLAIPDVEPARNSSMQLAQYTGMQLEGDIQEGRAKQKKVYPLTSVWRIFILTASMTADEALFRHAKEEASVSQWAFYTTKVTSYRLKEAGEEMARATTGCLDRALDQFQKGDFGAIAEAKELAQKVVSMSAGSADAASRLADIRRQEQAVRNAIDRGTALSKLQKWDDALSVWKPVTKYLKAPALTAFAASYDEALTGSHDSHVSLAKAALSNRGPSSEAAYREALKEYEIALDRRPDSAEAATGRRDAKVQIVLLEVVRYRAAKEPAKAYDALQAAIGELGENPQIAAVLKEVNCEYGLQLFEQARLLVAVLATPAPSRPSPARDAPASQKKPAPARVPASPAAVAPSLKVRVIQSPTDKKPFVEARAKLAQAMSLCAADDKLRLLASVNSALADYHVAQAKRALARKLQATALLNLQAAQAFQAERSDLEELIVQVREPVHQKAQIQAGVAVHSTSNQCGELAQQIAGAIESALVGAGGANIQLIGRDEAEQALRRIRSGSPGAMTGNFAIVSGQLGACNVNEIIQQRQVASRSQTPNQTYSNLQQGIQGYDRQVDDCKKAYPQTERTACQGLRSQRQGLQDQLARQQPMNLEDYTYTEQPRTTIGQMQLTLQIDDSILRGTRPAGSASGVLNESCVARSGYRENDIGNIGTIHNGTCPTVDKASKLLEMAEQVKAQAQTEAAAAMRGVAKSYLELAKRGTDQDIALENYIVFALLSADKSGPDYQQAMAAIHQRDPDLKPETALR